jgi:hypothetical protein
MAAYLELDSADRWARQKADWSVSHWVASSVDSMADRMDDRWDAHLAEHWVERLGI